ncbi:MAG TPA: hypothetical protein VNP03_21180 [Pseudonocardia sp.]|nr:hypothetical protein [Pseudonocardia sp.]
MAELTATAVAMINSSVELVHSALIDYESVRPLLLPDNFDDYRVLAGGQGAGTEVSWTLLVGETRRRRWQLGRPKREPWDCLVQVDEPADDQIVERDTRTELVTTWTVHEAGDGRTAVRVLASWPGPDGLSQVLTRSRQQLALRTIYEDILTRLHEHFEPPKPSRTGTPEPETATEPEEATPPEPVAPATPDAEPTVAAESGETPNRPAETPPKHP